MRVSRSAAAVLILAAVNLPLSSQAARVIDLTGRPVATLGEDFSTVSGFAEVAPGKAVVSDAREERLILADFSANRASNIGRKGNGPGEWGLVMNIVAGRPGQAYVQDLMNRRSHVVDASGRIVESVPLLGTESNSGAPGMIATGGKMRIDAQGRLYREAIAMMMGGPASDSTPIVRFDPRAGKTDTLAWIPTTNRVSTSSSGAPSPSASSGRTMSMRSVPGGKPLAPINTWDVFPDGRVAVVRGDPYRVDIYTNGRAVRGTPIAFTPVRVTRAERDAYRESRRNVQGTVITSAGAQRMPINNGDVPDGDFPEVMGPFTSAASVMMAPDGHIWVLRSRAAGDPNPKYDIIDGSGRVVAEARLRPGSSVIAFGADNAVYVVRTDPDTDLQQVEMYRRP